MRCRWMRLIVTSPSLQSACHRRRLDQGSLLLVTSWQQGAGQTSVVLSPVETWEVLRAALRDCVRLPTSVTRDVTLSLRAEQGGASSKGGREEEAKLQFRGC